MNHGTEQETAWICGKCQEKLILGKARLTYLQGNFEVELLKCPVCHNVFIDEDLALGKMLEVEKTLEDK